MPIPKVLVGQDLRGSHFCPKWELRITGRCLHDDLDRARDADFEEVRNVEIIKTFVKDRYTRTDDRSEVSPLTSGRTVWVLARGHDHRGGTWFDDGYSVVWLVAYRRHRSGADDDFFPFCKDLDKQGRLFPEEDDFERAALDADAQFGAAVRIEAPLMVAESEKKPGPNRFILGGELGIELTVEVEEDLRRLVIAFAPETVVFDYLPLILQAFHCADDWSQVEKLPSRDLLPGEIAFDCMYEVS